MEGTNDDIPKKIIETNDYEVFENWLHQKNKNPLIDNHRWNNCTIKFNSEHTQINSGKLGERLKLAMSEWSPSVLPREYRKSYYIHPRALENRQYYSLGKEWKLKINDTIKCFELTFTSFKTKDSKKMENYVNAYITYEVNVCDVQTLGRQYRVIKYETDEERIMATQEELSEYEVSDIFKEWILQYVYNDNAAKTLTPWKMAEFVTDQLMPNTIVCPSNKSTTPTFWVWDNKQHQWNHTSKNGVSTSITKILTNALNKKLMPLGEPLEDFPQDKNGGALQYLTILQNRIETNLIDMSIPKMAAMCEDLEFESRFDKNLDIFALKNGVIDLKTSTFRAKQRGDYVSMYAPVAWDESASCPVWLDTLDCICNGDQELIDHLQLQFGYCLTGHVNRQGFMIWYGLGSNGKSLIGNVMLRYIFGEEEQNYGYKGKENTLSKSKFNNGAGPSSHIAALRGKRFALFEESGKDFEFGPLYKELSGEGSISGRKLYKDESTFTPQVKCALATNYLPKIDGDDADTRRIEFYLFPNSYKTKEELSAVKDKPKNWKQKDLNLPSKLKLEAEGILQWCVQGAKRYYETDFDNYKVPNHIKEETLKYFAQASTSWVYALNITNNRQHRMLKTELEDAIGNYCLENNIKPQPKWREIKSMLTNKGLKWEKNKRRDLSNVNWMFMGVKKNVDEDEEEEITIENDIEHTNENNIEQSFISDEDD